MENYEFVACADGTFVARNSTTSKVVTEFDRDIIEFIVSEVKLRYPIAYKRLCEMYERYKGNRYNFEYRIAKRFVRCNMGADDLLSMDINNGIMCLEYVNCPLRGECCDENVICCPRHQSRLTETLRQVAELYASGMSYKEMAQTLNKSDKTIANQLRSITKILGLKRTKDIITYRIIYNF